MFLVGMGGSAIVVAVTLVHDLHDFFSDSGDTNNVPVKASESLGGR